MGIQVDVDRAAHRGILLHAQHARLAAFTAHLLGYETANAIASAEGDDELDRSLAYLRAIGTRITDEARDDELWAAITVMTGAFPSEADMVRAIASRDSTAADRFIDWFIAASAVPAIRGGSTITRLLFVQDAVVVDVDSCARFDRHTGIQRVERETLPIWNEQHDIRLVAWTERNGMFRTVSPTESARVLAWRGSAGDIPDDAGFATELVIPWRTTVVLPEVPHSLQSSRLRAMALYSGSSVSAIGYDLIPMTSPDLLPKEIGPDFLNYLGVVKRVEVVAAISESAAEEFRGFFDAVSAHGVPPARVVTCSLPAEVGKSSLPPHAGKLPVVLVVGSHEPRKNHLAVLHAAERLWREGLRFELWFLGGGGWGTYFNVLARNLARAGRPIVLKKAVSDDVIWAAFRDARFSVFPSLHEGYGLPVVESLGFGTPVITTDYGSTAEVAAGGGCLMVDPRNDGKVYDAMHTMLTDDATYAELKRAALARSFDRTWRDYARELWDILVVSEKGGAS